MTQATHTSKTTVGDQVLYMALELSNTKWKVLFANGAGKRREASVPARDVDGLMAAIATAKQRLKLPPGARVICCQEAGRDGFWIDRALRAKGIEDLVVDSSSIEVPRTKLRGTRRTLVEVLEVMLRAAHPMIPFITEALWQRVRTPLGIGGDTVMLQEFPVADDARRSPDDERSIEWIKAVVTGLRNIRGEMNIAPGRDIPVLLAAGDTNDRVLAQTQRQFLMRLTRLASLDWLEAGTQAPAAATALVGGMQVLVPLAGLIDVFAEQARLDKEIARRSAETERIRAKLDNDGFVARAPADVVAKERDKLEAAATAIATLRAQRAALDEL